MDDNGGPRCDEAWPGQQGEATPADELRVLAQSEWAVAEMFELLAETEAEPSRAEAYRRRAQRAIWYAERAERIARSLDARIRRQGSRPADSND